LLHLINGHYKRAYIGSYENPKKTENLNRHLNLLRSTKFAQNSAKIILDLTFVPLESYSLKEEEKTYSSV